MVRNVVKVLAFSLLFTRLKITKYLNKELTIMTLL